MSRNNSHLLARLPVETFQIIIDFLLPVPSAPIGTGSNFISCPDLLALRGTCRAFQAIVTASGFWINPNVNMARLNPSPTRVNVNPALDPFLNVLLDDPHLADRLSARRAWHFESVKILRKVVETIPSFDPTSVFLSLESDLPEEDLDIGLPELANEALLMLNRCHHLTFLELYFLQDGVVLNLSIIHHLYPLLETLRLIHIRGCSGSLRTLPKNLKKLVLHDVVHNDTNLFVPLDTFTTLEHLSLLDPTDHGTPFANALEGTLFGTFTNLTSLFLWPLSTDICKDLANSTLRLTELRATCTFDVGYDGEDEFDSAASSVLRLLSSDSCRTLRQLSLVLEFGDENFHENIVETITTRLTNLDDLTLGLGLSTTWFSLFARLRSLEKLVWYVPRDCWWDPLVPPLIRPSVTILTCTALDEFRKVLGNESLFVTIWVETELGYAHVSDCDDIPFIYNDGLYRAPFSTPYSYSHLAEGPFSECFCEDCLRDEEMN